MKLRHAAALVIVSWWLVQPPPNAANKPLVLAPIKDWTRIYEFSSYKECEGAIALSHRLDRSPVLHSAEVLEAEKQWAHKQGMAFNPDALRQFSDWEQCLAADDPLLKGN